MNAQANNTTLPLSSLFRDPIVRNAFERAERDLGTAPAVSLAPRPTLIGGAAKAIVRALSTVGGRA